MNGLKSGFFGKAKVRFRLLKKQDQIQRFYFELTEQGKIKQKRQDMMEVCVVKKQKRAGTGLQKCRPCF